MMRLLLMLLNLVFLYTQSELGRYYIRNFTSKEYKGHAQNWWIRKAPNNYIYSANTDGLLEYDGERWRKLFLSNLSIGRSFAFGEDETLYLGGQGDFGYLKANSVGQLQFQSLKDKVDSNHQVFQHVWRTHSLDNKIYFQTIPYIYQYDGKKFKYIAAEKNFHMSFILEKKFYVLDIAVGIKVLNGDKLELIKNGHLFPENRLRGFVRYDQKQILLASDTRMYLYDGNQFKAFSVANNGLFNDAMIYKLIELSSGNFALATRFKGILILNRSGQLKQVIDESNGLANNRVWDIYEDDEAHLWAALNNGISRIDIHSPYTIFTKNENGDKGKDFFLRYKNTLYRASTFGLMRLNKETENKRAYFEIIDGLNSNIWDFKVFNGLLYIASNKGLYTYNGIEFERIVEDPIRCFVFSKKNSRRIIYLKDLGIASIYFSNGTWQRENKFKELKINARFLVEDFNQQLFIGTDYDGVIRLDLKKLDGVDFKSIYHKYTTEHGLPHMRNNYTFEVNDQVLVASKAGPYRYNKVTDRFELDPRFSKKIFNGKRWVFFIQEDPDGNLWMSTGIDSKAGISFYKKNVDGSFSFSDQAHKYMRDLNIRHAYPEKDSIVWFASYDGAYRYDQSKKIKPLKFASNISAAIVNEDSIIYGGTDIENRSIELKYNENNIRFLTSSLSYLKAGKHSYRYKLIGYDENWTNWINEEKKDYTNLSPGSYQFLVKSRNLYHVESDIDSITFLIKEPWFWSIYSKSVYLLLFLYLLYLLVKVRSRVLEKRMLALEAIVEKRTVEVREQAERLKELDQLKSRFFANISHEFRTPLTLIKGPLENFQSSDYKGDLKKEASIALKHTLRLLDLINQLLDLSKLESGVLNLNYKKADLVIFLKRIAASFESYQIEKEIDFSFSTKLKSLPYVFDPERLEIILINLLSNAFKFTPRNGKISFTFERSKDKQLLICVEDDGIGIKTENFEKIFDRFYQEDSSDTKAYQGTGIGLSLTKELVELHGGSIEIESEEGKGSKFLIRLAEKADLLEREDIKEYDFEANSPDPLYGILKEQKSEGIKKDKQVLIVEDNTDLRNYLMEILSIYYRCLEAENGKKALALAEEEEIDLILSDVMMPEMDGFEFTRAIKTNRKTSHLPVLLLTARSADEDKIKGLETGADDYILKPFNQEELKLRIHNLLKSREVLREKYAANIFADASELVTNSTDEAFIKKLNDLIQKKLSESEFDRNYLAEELGLSLSNLYRKIKALTNMSPAEYIKSIRLKYAIELMKTTNLNLSEICMEIGFNNLAHFSREFKKQFEQSPKDYMKELKTFIKDI